MAFVRGGEAWGELAADGIDALAAGGGTGACCDDDAPAGEVPGIVGLGLRAEEDALLLLDKASITIKFFDGMLLVYREISF